MTNPTTAFPIISLLNIFHVGTMNKNMKRKGSLEGSGLSISTEPEAWKQINPFTAGDTFLLKKKNNHFLNYHKITKKHMNAIKLWGVNKGYITLCPIYTFNYEDAEMNQKMCFFFSDKQKALEEADGYDIAENEVTELEGFVSTHLMDKRTMSHTQTINDLQLLSTLYAEDVLQLDGVWWEDKLDVLRYSAPRCVIFSTKLNGWIVEKK